VATGRPVVGTPIRSLLEFDKVLRLATTPEEWSAAICACLGPEANLAEQRAIRQARAREFDWEIIVRRIAETLAARLNLQGWKRP